MAATAAAGDELPAVPRDPGRLAQVFQNLVQNAVQHSKEGQTVWVEARSDGESWVECLIRDGGPGFKPEDLSRIFEPFLTRRRGGTGLGLSIVQRIVEQHGGTLAAANHPQGGALLTVRLPRPARPN